MREGNWQADPAIGKLLLLLRGFNQGADRMLGLGSACFWLPPEQQPTGKFPFKLNGQYAPGIVSNIPTCPPQVGLPGALCKHIN